MESLAPKIAIIRYWLCVVILTCLMCCVSADEGNQEQPQDNFHHTVDKEGTDVCTDEKSNCDSQNAVVNKDKLIDDISKTLVHENIERREKEIEETNTEVESQINKNAWSENNELSENSDLEFGQRKQEQNEIKVSENPNSEPINDNTETQEPVHIKNNSVSSNNTSVVGEWFKYFIDSFLEEFKEGVISRQLERGNNSNSSDINTTKSEETALDANVSNVSAQIDTIKNDTEAQNGTDTGKKMKFECIGRNVTDNSNATVRIITSAKLLQLLTFDKNDTENITDCIVVMFYAPWCKFCARTAPHFNALARAFPQLDFVAVDTAQFSNILARFGTVSVPNVLVFHQSRSTVKFNQTERVFPNFVSFLKNATGLEPNTSVEISEVDYIGPVPSVPTDDPDYLLLLSWVFVIFCSLCMFVKSTKGQQWITRVRVLWQEHQHID